MALITIDKSVGRGGTNQPLDIVAIGAALVALGVDRGGLFAPPLSIDGLAQAIESFQRFQRLPTRDGKVDRDGATLRQINALLNPGGLLPPSPKPSAGGAGQIRPLQSNATLANSVKKSAWTPVESSLIKDQVFQWTSVAGSGTIAYFELTENVVPRWFGVLVPTGLTRFDRVHLFFHPTPAQAHIKDSDYATLGGFANVFHYLSDDFGAQFCAAGTNRVMVMPLMTQSAAGDCGVFPQRWESILNQIFALLGSKNGGQPAAPSTIQSVVVSSFSSGIAYSHQFRQRAQLGARLSGVIDFDGIFSTARSNSAALSGPAGHVVRMQQGSSPEARLPILAVQNNFPLGRPRWGGPFANLFSKNPTTAGLEIHGSIPQRMMFIAARRAG
jgi:hypothetical protein